MNPEQIKMAAAACNNLGVGALLAGTIVPMMNSQSHSLAWYVFGLMFLGPGRPWRVGMTDLPLWIDSGIGAVIIVVLLTRQALRRRRHPAE